MTPDPCGLTHPYVGGQLTLTVRRNVPIHCFPR